MKRYEVTPEVRLNPQETTVLVVDMQNDFAHPDGALFVPEAKAQIPVIADFLSRVQSTPVRTVFTADTHVLDDPEFHVWPQHAVSETWGWNVVDELKPFAGTIQTKNTYDAFACGSSETLLDNRTNVVLCGTVANICVLHTALSASRQGHRIVLLEDAVSALDEFDREYAFKHLQLMAGATVTTTVGLKF